MKIVIDIFEDVYEDAKNGIPNGLDEYSNEAIRNGIPLPEGHGDLIDRSALREELIENEWINGIDSGGLENIIDEATAVIPADK